ncbi:MAG: hypothetical protein KatS3mg077_1520 [Candidatus Binatia bacterium]|nr:MAG: hypothetical protein KatS3mg077_1520 [Candidatus Binatia bacterium]
MSKASRDPTLEKGEALLRSWGLEPSSPIESLAEQVGRDPAADLAIARWLGDRGDAAAFDLLERLAQSEAGKAVRREARRSLYRLQQRGIGRAENPREVVARPLWQPEPEATQAFYRPYSAGGRRDFLLARKYPGHWVILLAGTENFDARLAEVRRITTSAKQWRELVRQATSAHDGFARGDERYCDFLLWRAYGNLPPSQRTAERDYLAYRAEFFSLPPPEKMDSPIVTLYPPEEGEALSEEVRQADTKDLWSRFAVLELARAASSEVAPFVERVLALEESPLILSDALKLDRQLQIQEEALQAIFAEEKRPSWVHRLREVAYYFHLKGDSAAARSLANVALALETPGIDPKQVAFCRDLTRLALGLALEQRRQEEKERAAESLVVTPQQLLRAQQRKPNPDR